MKKHFQIILLFLFVSINGLAQCPIFNSVRFETQEEIDEFVTQYPNCTELREVVMGYDDFSGPSSNIKDISGLKNLARVEGNFVIRHVDSLETLDGLQNMQYIGRDLRIIQNDKLRNLAIFENLDTIGGRLAVNLNDSLTNLEGFKNLEYIGNYVNINFNRNLTRIDGFQKITELYDYLDIRDSPKLQSLQGFHNIRKIEGRLSINEVGLENLVGLNALDSIIGGFGWVSIRDCPNLKSLDGLNNLHYIGTNLYVDNCEALDTIEVFKQTTSIGGNFRISNTGLHNLNEWSQIEIGGGFVNIHDNRNLKSLKGLQVTSKVLGYLEVSENDELIDISSLMGIDTVSGDLVVRSNGQLADCSSICSLLDEGYIDGRVTILGNSFGCSSEMEITASGCTTQSEDYAENMSLRIMSNPVNDFIHVTGYLDAPTKADILSVHGSTVFSKLMNEGDESYIDVTGLSSGIYFLKIGQASFVFVKK